MLRCWSYDTVWGFTRVHTWSIQDGGFDVIHFNWGLHEICAKMYAPVTIAQYIANMRSLIPRMRAKLAKPKGQLIWSTTTPVPPSYKNRNNSDVVAINAAMATLLAEPAFSDIVTNDLYGEVVARCRRDVDSTGYPQTDDCLSQQNDGVHFSAAGKQFTAIKSASVIAQYL